MIKRIIKQKNIIITVKKLMIGYEKEVISNAEI